MEKYLENYNYYIRPGMTDMRKGYIALALMIQNEMELDPFSRSVFAFCGSSKRIVKFLKWDRNGWMQLTKHIASKERFHWPKDEIEAREVSIGDLKAFMDGQDPWTRFEDSTPLRV